MDNIKFNANTILPNPIEVTYWVDLSDNPYGGSIKYYNGVEWVRLAASGGIPDLSKYYTKIQTNALLNNKADVSSVESKVSDEEVKDVVKNISFRTSIPNEVSMVIMKYDGTNVAVTLPIASANRSGIITADDFKSFVNELDLVKLYDEMYDIAEDIRFKYQKKLTPGLNILIDENNVISASGDLSVQWDNILGTPDFKPVATSGDYNDLINKLKAGKYLNIDTNNIITFTGDFDAAEANITRLDNELKAEIARAELAESSLQNLITTEQLDRITAVTQETNRALAAEKKLTDNLAAEVVDRKASVTAETNRALAAEKVLTTNLLNEVNRATQVDTTHSTEIAKEILDRIDAINAEVLARDAAILVETNRAISAETELNTRIEDHTDVVLEALALKSDKANTYTKEQVDLKVAGAYKVKGSSTFENLPLTNNVVGDTYSITNEFTLDNVAYPPGTNIVWTEEGWDALTGIFDSTKIEGDIQKVADDLVIERVERINADANLTASDTALSNRITVVSDKIHTIQGSDAVIGSIENALKQAKDHTDTSVLTLSNETKGLITEVNVDLVTEVNRATTAEALNATNLLNEINRSINKDTVLTEDVLNLTDVKVDKIAGKLLSTEDYTTAEKTKLSGILNNANNYTLPIATATMLGGVKVGNNITLSNGIISLSLSNVMNALGSGLDATYLKKNGDIMSGYYRISYVSYAQTPDIYRDNEHDVTIRLLNKNGFLGEFGSTSAISAEYPNQPIYVDNKRATHKLLHTGNYSPTLDTRYVKKTGDIINGVILIDGVVLVNPKDLAYAEGIRIKNTVNEISTIVLGTDGSDTGRIDGQWSIIKLPNKHFAISPSGSQGTNNVAPAKGLGINYHTGDIFTGNKLFVSANSVIDVNPLITLAIGDNDTGINWVKDGQLEFKSNGSRLLGFNYHSVTIDKDIFIKGKLTAIIEDWYGVSWSEDSSNPDCTRIGNMEMHKSLPILSMMRGCKITNQLLNWGNQIRYINEDWSSTIGGWGNNDSSSSFDGVDTNIMVEIPEFWYIDDYNPSTKTHNLKLSMTSKPGWKHHKLAYVSAYEGAIVSDSGMYQSRKTKVPTVSQTRTTFREKARLNDPNSKAWNIYTYEEHRAICHLFLVEYATRYSQKAVNNTLTVEGFRQGGLGTGCTSGVVNGQYSFIPVGTSDSLGHGSGEVTWTDGTNSRKCNRYRGIENPFGHVWKHCDDVISKYTSDVRLWYKCDKPSLFATNKTSDYSCIAGAIPTTGWKKNLVITPNCDFFPRSVGGSETTYWCDYNWDNTDTSEHCLLIGGSSGNGGHAGLFYLDSADGVGRSHSYFGSRLTYLPWAD